MDDKSLYIAGILIVLVVLYRFGGSIINVAIGLAVMFVIYQTLVFVLQMTS